MYLLDAYQVSRKALFDYFGMAFSLNLDIPFDDGTAYFWRVIDGSFPEVVYANSPENLDVDGEFYSSEIYFPLGNQKSAFRGQDHTVVCVSSQTDGYTYFRVFDNAKERPNAE